MISHRANVNMSIMETNPLPVIGSDDFVIYLAGLQAGRGVPDHEYFQANTGSVKNFILSCPADIRLFVYVSTVRVYGDHGPHRINEDSEYLGTTRYARSKIMVERLLENYHRNTGLRYCILQPSFVYGADDAKGFMSNLLRFANLRVFPLVDGGENVLNFIYIQDLVSIIEHVIKKPDKCTCRKFIAGYPEDVSLHGIFQMIKSLQNRRIVPVRVSRTLLRGLAALKVLSRGRVDTLTANIKVDASRVYGILGVDPKVNIRAGLSKILTDRE